MEINDRLLMKEIATLRKKLLNKDAIICSLSQENKENKIQLYEIKRDLHNSKRKLVCLNTENGKLRFQINKLLGYRFGSSSEKFEDKQISLLDEANVNEVDVEEIKEADESITVSSFTRKKTGRKPLPDHLPREELVHDLSDAEKICGCGHALHKIGEDVSEQLDLIPAKIKVIVHRRCKYACRSCEEGVTLARLPAQPIPKSIATAGLLSHILVSKYVDHLPLYRQEEMLQRLKVDIVRSTLSYWILRCAELLSPLVEELKRDLRQSQYMQADETHLQVLNEPGRSNESTSYLWGYRGIGPPGGGVIVFEYQPSRSGKHAEEFLEKFSGCLQTDGYQGYHGLRKRDGIVAYGCMAHARRKFMDIIKANKKASAAQAAVNYIGRLYKIEKQAREEELIQSERYLLRQEKAKPILKEFKAWLDKNIGQVPPQNPIAQAMQYTLNQWLYLERYADNGLIEIDNNLLENAIRPIALGRRNWLFSGSVEGAKASSTMFSLVLTCRENGVEPYTYFKTVLNKVTECKTNEDYRQLLPYSIDREELLKAYQ